MTTLQAKSAHLQCGGSVNGEFWNPSIQSPVQEERTHTWVNVFCWPLKSGEERGQKSRLHWKIQGPGFSFLLPTSHHKEVNWWWAELKPQRAVYKVALNTYCDCNWEHLPVTTGPLPHWSLLHLVFFFFFFLEKAKKNKKADGLESSSFSRLTKYLVISPYSK